MADDSYVIACSACGKRLRVKNGLQGREIKCPCGAIAQASATVGRPPPLAPNPALEDFSRLREARNRPAEIELERPGYIALKIVSVALVMAGMVGMLASVGMFVYAIFGGGPANGVAPLLLLAVTCLVIGILLVAAGELITVAVSLAIDVREIRARGERG